MAVGLFGPSQMKRTQLITIREKKDLFFHGGFSLLQLDFQQYLLLPIERALNLEGQLMYQFLVRSE